MNRTTVSFAEVLAAARLGRARIAPEMAGYLALGVADALVGQALVVDERSCMLTDEGGVFVAPANSAISQDAPMEPERAVRQLLASLLDVARGGGTTLATVARRSSTSSIEALIAEIEAALIPVNRAAARRALARLSRETAKARDDGQLVLQRPRPAEIHSQPPERDEDTEPIRVPLPSVSTPPPPDTRHADQGDPARSQAVDPRPMETAARPSAPPTATSDGQADPAGSAMPSAQKPFPTRADELLARFSGNVSQTDQEIARELKAMAGLEPTPPPPMAAPQEPTPTPPPASPPSDVATVGGGFEDAPFDLPIAGRSRGSSYLLGLLLVMGIAATIAVWMYYPEFFTGE